MHTGRPQPQFSGGLRIQHTLCQSRLRRARQGSGQGRIGGKVHATIQGYFVTRKQRRGIHVMLQKGIGHHHIAHLGLRCEPACHAGEQHLVYSKTLDQYRGGGGCGHLANARKHRHHLLPMPAPEHELAPRRHLRLSLRQPGQHGRQFGVHGADDGDSGHEASKK